VKKDILSVSELPTHTTSREIFKVSNGFYWRERSRMEKLGWNLY
jgi:hypothetical protein